MAIARHLTFARVVSVLAIFIALGSGAYAAGLGKSSVKSKQIKDGAVATKDLKDGAVDGSKVADGSLTASDIANDGLSGADVAEASLTGVSALNSARVGGLQVRKINYQVPIANGVVRSILDYQGIFRIDAQCANVGDGLDLTAFTAIDHTKITVVGVRGSGADDTDLITDFTSATNFDLNANQSFEIDELLPSPVLNAVTLRVTTPTGFTAVIDLYTRELGGSDCTVTGTAVSS